MAKATGTSADWKQKQDRREKNRVLYEVLAKWVHATPWVLDEVDPRTLNELVIALHQPMELLQEVLIAQKKRDEEKRQKKVDGMTPLQRAAAARTKRARSKPRTKPVPKKTALQKIVEPSAATALSAVIDSQLLELGKKEFTIGEAMRELKLTRNQASTAIRRQVKARGLKSNGAGRFAKYHSTRVDELLSRDLNGSAGA